MLLPEYNISYISFLFHLTVVLHWLTEAMPQLTIQMLHLVIDVPCLSSTMLRYVTEAMFLADAV